MVLQFTKMNGAGNDFILADDRSQSIRLTREQITRLCDRHRGVGADGLFFLVPCSSGRADWAWRFYNSDGSEAEMCGNGARCFARFVQRLTGVKKGISFETGAGVIGAAFEGELVTVDLTRPKDLRLGQKVDLTSGTEIVHFVNTGVPHVVVFVADADRAQVSSLGREIRNHRLFAPAGTNVNFVQLAGSNCIRVRTYERGVEGETLACGTGVTAAALITARVNDFAPPISVQVQGGDTLQVSFKGENGGFRDVRLTGPAEFVFQGTVEI